MNLAVRVASFRRYVFLAVLAAAITSYTNFGHSTGDEYSQIFEFAAHKLGYVAHADLRLWEFDNHMRSSIQPWAVVATYRLVGLFTPEVNPFLVSYLLYLLSGLLSIYSIVVFTNAFATKVRPQYHGYLLLLSLFSWLVLYTNTHFNSEHIGGHLLLLSVGLLYGRLDHLRLPDILCAGGLLGLAFSCRFQIGFAILGLFLWMAPYFWRMRRPGRWLALLCGTALSVLLFTVVADYFFYGRWVFTPYNYYYQNIATGIMSRSSGVSPWYVYPLAVCAYIPFGPVYVLATLAYIIKRPGDILSWIVGPFILCHLLIGHKEVRFLLPMLGFMPVMVMVTMEDWTGRFAILSRNLAVIVRVLWTVNLLACLSLLLPAATEIGGWYYLYRHYTKPTVLYYSFSEHQKLLFYKRPNIRLVKVTPGDPTPCPDGTSNCLLAVDANGPGKKPDYPLVYTFFPKPLGSILPNPVTRSVGHFDIYEIRNIEGAGD